MASASCSAASSDVTRALALLLLAGCGRLAFDSATGASDAAPLDDTPVDAYSCASGPYTTDLSARPAWMNTWHTPTGNGVSITFTGGALRLQQSSVAEEWGGVNADTLESFAERSIAAELVQAPAEGAAFLTLDIGGPPWARIGTNLETGELVISHYDPPFDDPFRTPYDPVAHRFLRIRVHASSVYFEASPDGMRYTVLYESERRPFLDAVSPGLGVGSTVAPTPPGEAVFESLRDCAP